MLVLRIAFHVIASKRRGEMLEIQVGAMTAKVRKLVLANSEHENILKETKRRMKALSDRNTVLEMKLMSKACVNEEALLSEIGKLREALRFG